MWLENKGISDLKFKFAGLAEEHLRILAQEETEGLSQEIEHCESRLNKLSEEISKALHKKIPECNSERFVNVSHKGRFSPNQIKSDQRKILTSSSCQPKCNCSPSQTSSNNSVRENVHPSICSIILHPCSPVINFQHSVHDATHQISDESDDLSFLNNVKITLPIIKQGLGKIRSTKSKIVEQNSKGQKFLKPRKKKARKIKPCKCVCMRQLGKKSRSKYKKTGKFNQTQYQKNIPKRYARVNVKQPYKKNVKPVTQNVQARANNYQENPYPQAQISLNLKGVQQNQRPHFHAEPMGLASGSSSLTEFPDNILFMKESIERRPYLHVEPIDLNNVLLNASNTLPGNRGKTQIQNQNSVPKPKHVKRRGKNVASLNLNRIQENIHGIEKRAALPSKVLQNQILTTESVGQSESLEPMSESKKHIPRRKSFLKQTRPHLYAESVTVSRIPSSLNGIQDNLPYQRRREPMNETPNDQQNPFPSRISQRSSFHDPNPCNSVLTNNFPREGGEPSPCRWNIEERPNESFINLNTPIREPRTEPCSSSVPSNLSTMPGIGASNVLGNNYLRKDPMEEHRLHFTEKPVRERSSKDKVGSTLDIINQIGSIRQKLREGSRIILNVDPFYKRENLINKPPTSHREKRPETKPPPVKRSSIRKKAVTKETNRNFKTNVIFYLKMFVVMFAVIMKFYFD